MTLSEADMRRVPRRPHRDDLPGAGDQPQSGAHRWPSRSAKCSTCHLRAARRAGPTERMLELLRQVGIADPGAATRPNTPSSFSGGMKQRVMIAIALAGEPELLIADEPTTALDVTVQAQILDLLAKIQVDRGMGMLLITHDLGVVARMAHRIGVMYAGELVEVAGREEFFTQPRHPERVDIGGQLALAPQVVPRHPHRPVWMNVRPIHPQVACERRASGSCSGVHRACEAVGLALVWPAGRGCVQTGLAVGPCARTDRQRPAR